MENFIEDEDDIIDCMEKYGGSFVKALAIAYRHADHYNRGKIRGTWQDYWATYKKMANRKQGV